MAVAEYMIRVYAHLVAEGKRTVESLPDDYRVPVAEYLATKLEAKL